MTNLPMVCPRESDDQTSNRERERESSALSSSSETIDWLGFFWSIQLPLILKINLKRNILLEK